VHPECFAGAANRDSTWLISVKNVLSRYSSLSLMQREAIVIREERMIA
jgi:hypothetical protein